MQRVKTRKGIGLISPCLVGRQHQKAAKRMRADGTEKLATIETSKKLAGKWKRMWSPTAAAGKRQAMQPVVESVAEL
jgi:hypothetical protein